MMASCDKIRKKFDPYFDGTLDEKEFERIQKHLASCDACRLVFEEERLWLRELAALPLIPCPKRVTDAVLANGDSRKHAIGLPAWQKRLSGRLLWKPVLAFLFLLILAFAWKGDVPLKSGKSTVYSPEEIRQATDVVKWSMMFSAQTIRKSETQAFGVLADQLPKTVRQSVRMALPKYGGNE